MERDSSWETRFINPVPSQRVKINVYSLHTPAAVSSVLIEGYIRVRGRQVFSVEKCVDKSLGLNYDRKYAYNIIFPVTLSFSSSFYLPLPLSLKNAALWMENSTFIPVQWWWSDVVICSYNYELLITLSFQRWFKRYFVLFVPEAVLR